VQDDPLIQSARARLGGRRVQVMRDLVVVVSGVEELGTEGEVVRGGGDHGAEDRWGWVEGGLDGVERVGGWWEGSEGWGSCWVVEGGV
jgi:hypothetical protein